MPTVLRWDLIVLSSIQMKETSLRMFTSGRENTEVKIWLHDLTVALTYALLRMKLAISFVIYESIGESC
jgi:hypothetical protein